MTIPDWFLWLGIFFPRITLFFSYLYGNIPPNNVPFWGDFFGAIFIPRFLIAFYIYNIYGFSGWFWAYIIVGILALGSESNTVSKK